MDDSPVTAYLRPMFGNREYRLYVTSELATFCRDLRCADDNMAREQAQRLFPNHLVEIWLGNRLVGRIDATSEPA